MSEKWIFMRSIKSHFERYAVRSDVCDRYTKDEPPTCRSGFNQL